MLFSLFQVSIAYSTNENKTEIPMYMITTRDILFSKDIDGKGYGNSTYSFLNTSELKNKFSPEVTIFVHGWNNDQTKAEERVDRLKMALVKK